MYFFLDLSNQANLLLVNLKEVVDKLQAKNICFKTQVEKLTNENKQLRISNKKLSIELNCVKEDLKTKVTQ